MDSASGAQTDVSALNALVEGGIHDHFPIEQDHQLAVIDRNLEAVPVGKIGLLDYLLGGNDP